MTETIEEAMGREVTEMIRDLAERRQAVRMDVFMRVREELEGRDRIGYYDPTLAGELCRQGRAEHVAAGLLEEIVNCCLQLENLHLVRGAGMEVKP